MKHDTEKQILYPCRWLYKVIGSDQNRIVEAIEEVVGDIHYTVSLSNTSSKGKYHCLNLELIVSSEKNRNSLYQALKAHPAIIMVL